MVINHNNEISSKTVKKYLKKPDFFEEVSILSQNLLPIKTAITVLEGEATILADVFIQLVRLAYKIKRINNGGMIEFKKYATTAFNKRWDELDVSIYLLAYFLHLGYRSQYYSLLL